MSKEIINVETVEREVKLNIYQKVSELRERLLKVKMTKSGRNTFSKYDYFELQDFIPTVIKLEKELGLLSLFTMNDEEATLVVTDVDSQQSLLFTSPRADAQGKGQLPIQALGSQHTYLRRYLYINYLNLSESDGVDGLSNEQKGSKSNLATKKQRDLIESLYTHDELMTMLERMNKALMELSVEEASKMIEARKK